MTVLKKNFNLHPFTAPSADTNTAAPESNGAGGKEGGETLKLPRPFFKVFSDVLHVYRLIEIGAFDAGHMESLDTPPSFFSNRYEELLNLGKLSGIVPEEYKDTIVNAIQEKAYELAESLSNNYPILKPIFEWYVDVED